MAQRFPEAEDRIFKNVYICIKCNARNRVKNPEEAHCRKCGCSQLRKKHEKLEVA